MDKEIIEKYFKDGETAQNTLEELGLFEQVAKQYILTKDMEVINYFLSLRPNEKEKEMTDRENIIINFIDWYYHTDKERKPLYIGLEDYLKYKIYEELEGDSPFNPTNEKGEGNEI